MLIGFLAGSPARSQGPDFPMALPSILPEIQEVAQDKAPLPPLLPEIQELAQDKPGKEKEKPKEPPPPVALFDVPEDLDETEWLPRAPEMLGDLPPPPVFLSLPGSFVPKTIQTTIPLGHGKFQVQTIVINQQLPGGGVVLPSTRAFKIADNNSPRPQDRVFFSFNYYDDLFAASNTRLNTGVQDMRLYREYFGMEKTFLDGNGSICLRLPLNTLDTQSGFQNIDGSHTGLGDLTVVGRYALYRDSANDNWITAGLAITTPSGPSTIAGIGAPSITHSTLFQPFLGYLWNFGDFYLQGFFAVDTPSDSRDPTLLFNDVGLGYFLYRSADPTRWVRAIAPTFEVHVSNPLNHPGPIGPADPLAASNLVDLGFAANFALARRSWLAVGLVTPVTGPKPFSTEALVQFRVRY
jgi:hypothetical protein